MYEELGSLERAARLYEQTGDHSHAAELYHRTGQYGQARSIWEMLGEWENLVGLLLADQKPAEAAQILELQGHLERAAELYEQANQPRPGTAHARGPEALEAGRASGVSSR